MAQYCDECADKHLGINKLENEKAGWYCGKNGFCEGCGYEHLKRQMKK